MKLPSLFIATSLAGNAALLAVLFLRPAPRHEILDSKSTASSARARPRASVQDPVSTVDPKLWKNLTDVELPAQIARLRAAGFPPTVVRAIISAQIQDAFDARRRALNPATHSSAEFWKNASVPDAKIATALRQLSLQQTRLINELLGPNPELHPFEALYDRNSTRGLPTEKAHQLTRIKRDYEEMRSEISAGSAGGLTRSETQAKLNLLEKEQRADMERMLTPDELASYDLRTSGTADAMRLQLAGFNPTEAEFRAIYEKRRVFDERYNVSAADAQFMLETGFGGSPEFQRQQAEAQQQLTAQIVAALGPERGADYERSLDRNFQQINRVAERLGLRVSASVEAWTVQKNIQQRAQALQANRELTPETRHTELTALATEATAKLTTALGPRGFDVYRENGGQWLQTLSPRPAGPSPVAGTPGSGGGGNR